MPKIRISGTKLIIISMAPDSVPQKMGPWNGDFAEGSKNGALEVRGPRLGTGQGEKKKDLPPCPAVQYRVGIFCRALRALKQTLICIRKNAKLRLAASGTWGAQDITVQT